MRRLLLKLAAARIDLDLTIKLIKTRMRLSRNSN